MTARQKYRRKEARAQILRNVGIALGAIGIMCIVSPLAFYIGNGI